MDNSQAFDRYSIHVRELTATELQSYVRSLSLRIKRLEDQREKLAAQVQELHDAMVPSQEVFDMLQAIENTLFAKPQAS